MKKRTRKSLITGSKPALIADVETDGVRIQMIGKANGNEAASKNGLARFVAMLLAARILEESGDKEAANRVRE